MRKPLPTPEEIAQLPPDGGEEFNRLIFEKSPYLLQHARNPVDWYPWGDAAFERARQEDKMVFLSVGYSTCHWCHVMEHESFEDEEVAKLMNAAFVCVKVDREERPDIDQVYMTVTQAMTGSGGWPMTVVMTPDKKPFFAGTYYPKTGRFGQPGMMELIPKLQAVWKDQRAEAIAAADGISNQLASVVSGSPGAPLTETILKKAFSNYSETFDPERGGFRGARKFPTPHNLSFLLRYWKRTQNPEALEIVEKTLKAMRLGGVWDHIGFGTHRYSTDSDWLLPHFEKMLYDQALLAIANVEAYQVTDDPFYAKTAREILAYVLRDMTADEGGFFSAEDADSEGEEGLFYLWTVDEVQEVLGEDLGALFIDVYNLKPEGNYFDEATRKKTGKNIPHLKKPLQEIASERGQPAETLHKKLEAARKRLFEAREQRIHPLKDDKILTDWNGLMIAAMARAGQGLGDEKYTRAARAAADLVLAKLRTADGRLLKRRRLGESGLPAHLDDYAFMVWALTDLYQATFEFDYLEAALELNQTMLDQFWDDENGGLFLTADDAEKLIVRSKEIYDGAIPSGNSVAAYNCARLAKITANDTLAERSEQILTAFSGAISQNPSAYSMSLIALDFATSPGSEIVLAGDKDAEALQKMAHEIRQRFEPHNILIHRPLGDDVAIADVAPYAQTQIAIDGQPTAYVCRNYACELPTGDFDQFLTLLDKISTSKVSEKPAPNAPVQNPIE